MTERKHLRRLDMKFREMIKLGQENDCKQIISDLMASEEKEKQIIIKGIFSAL